MAEQIEMDFENIIDMLEQNNIDEAKSELNLLKDYVVRRMTDYEENYKRVSDSELYDVNDYDFI
jgi:hypothetical protein